MGRRQRGWKWRFGSGGVGNGGGPFGRCEWEERVRKVGEGLTDAVGASKGKENVKTAIVIGGGREVEASGTVLGPRCPGLGGIKGNDKLAGGVNRVGGKAKGDTMQTMPGGKRGVGFPGTEGVERELGLGKEVRPAVGRKRDVDSRHNREDVIFGGTNRSFRRERAMVLGRDVLVGDVMF